MNRILMAGDPAPADGLYRVTHYQHRLPHTVSIVNGTVLPVCLKCGDHVRFELIGPARQDSELRSDTDFQGGVP